MLKAALGDSDSRATFDFDGDGIDDSCRIVSGRTSYFLCTSPTKVLFGEIDEPGLRDWTREWVDWDGDGRKDWCRIVGEVRGAKRLRCNFNDGKAMDQSATSDVIDVGYPISGPHSPPIFEARNGAMNYCRITGSFDFPEWRECLAASGRGFGQNDKRRP